jgi:hypothetical protein
MSPDQLKAAIAVVVGDIEDELAGISPLVGLAAHRPLDFIETAAAAQIIHSFTAWPASGINQRGDGKVQEAIV